MAVAYFTIPETGKIIYNGDTVILSEYPDTIAAVAYGWYKYEETAMNGWHFILLPSKSIIPAANVNLSLLTVVPNSSDDDRNPILLNTSLQDIESRAFITLDSIAQRDKLIPEFMPNGRIVRVNDSVNHTTNYYEWNIETQSWDGWNIQKMIQREEVTINVADWSENIASINSVAGITAETKLIIQPKYGYSQHIWNQCGIYQSDQLNNYIEFCCDTVPQDDIQVNIYIL